ncbi:hypothetical protein [Mesobacillus maritimus]|uniref:hypothetical protein n=1 Tax=Mesobacillus maritimus TaxID=1643336 RepID=UPI00384B0239
MKKRFMILSFTFALLLLGGCASNSNEETTTDSSENSSRLESPEDATTNKNDSTNEGQESDTDDATDVSSEADNSISENSEGNESDKEDKEALARYSSEEIEYARVWLQLGPNKDIDGLYVRLIPVGTPLNPDDETSLNYPEDVIQLAGSRLIDGSVTYSGNGNGTINVYNVPLRWDGIYPAGEEFYKEMIENTKLVSIDPGDEEDVIKLIKLITVHDY